MSFARKQLEKYGWREGKGLGKHEDGISKDIKPKLKFDNSGIGNNAGDQFADNWWERIFDTAASNLNVEVDEGVVEVKLNSEMSVKVSIKNNSIKEPKDNKDPQYGSYRKSAKTTESGVEHHGTTAPGPTGSNRTCPVLPLKKDERGSRHGIKQTAKLSRLEKQEKMLLKKMRNVSISDGGAVLEKKIKKLKKHKEETSSVAPSLDMDTTDSTSSSKKKKKKRKSVTFNDETVVKFYTPELDTSSATSKSDDSVDPNPNNDEGIEQDAENNNSVSTDNHRSFEEAQYSFNDLSRAERKKLKKKRKLEKKHNATTKFIENVLEDAIDVCVDDENCKKRKFVTEDMETGQGQVADLAKKKKCVPELDRRARKEQRRVKREKKMINSIVKSLNNFCKISDNQ